MAAWVKVHGVTQGEDCRRLLRGACIKVSDLSNNLCHLGVERTKRIDKTIDRFSEYLLQSLAPMVNFRACELNGHAIKKGMGQGMVRNREATVYVLQLLSTQSPDIRALMHPTQFSNTFVQPCIEIESRTSAMSTKNIRQPNIGCDPVIPALDDGEWFYVLLGQLSLPDAR